jgi:hypothetical protein
VQEKIETIARDMYGAAGVEYEPAAEEAIEKYTRMGFSGLPICMAKTQYSFRCTHTHLPLSACFSSGAWRGGWVSTLRDADEVEVPWWQLWSMVRLDHGGVDERQPGGGVCEFHSSLSLEAAQGAQLAAKHSSSLAPTKLCCLSCGYGKSRVLED